MHALPGKTYHSLALYFRALSPIYLLWQRKQGLLPASVALHTGPFSAQQEEKEKPVCMISYATTNYGRTNISAQHTVTVAKAAHLLQ